MPKVTNAAREAKIERRNIVDAFLQTSGPVSCAQICAATGLNTYHTQAAIRGLCEGGAARHCGTTKTPASNGYFNKTLLYETTGQPYNHGLAASIHTKNQKLDHCAEPEGGVIERRIGPHHRLVRFGKKSYSGKGQSCEAAPYTGGCSLISIF